jgi:hypothetical protein
MKSILRQHGGRKVVCNGVPSWQAHPFSWAILSIRKKSMHLVYVRLRWALLLTQTEIGHGQAVCGDRYLDDHHLGGCCGGGYVLECEVMSPIGC